MLRGRTSRRLLARLTKVIALERRRERLLRSARRDAVVIMQALRQRGVPDMLLARAYLGGLGETAPTVAKVVDAKKAVRARRARQNRKTNAERGESENPRT
jgi:hypothetical protein